MIQNSEKENLDFKANLAAALSAAQAGCPVFPCSPNNKKPLVKWQTLATTDQQKIYHLWKKYPNAMPGLVTGASSGLAVVDLDVKKGKNG